MHKLVRILLPVCVLLFFKPTLAQDIRSAWIDYKFLSGNTYSVSATLVIDSATAQSHTAVANYFGDGDSCVSSTANSTSGKFIVYKYSCTHTYSGPGTFNVFLNDKYRVAGINNMANSAIKDMFVSALLKIGQFSGPNSSPIFSMPPMTASKGTIYTFNLGLYDIDGDSLSYHIINCAITPTTSYYIPANCSIDQFGTFTYQADTVGLYAFKIQIKEWRKDGDSVYQMIGFSEIDFTIEVKAAVGINELVTSNLFILYPNPSSTILNIKTEEKFKEILIHNSLGQIILDEPFHKGIDVSKFPEGYYTLKLIGEKTLYSKFIKE